MFSNECGISRELLGQAVLRDGGFFHWKVSLWVRLASQPAPFAAAQTEVGRRTHDIQKWNHRFSRMDSKHSASV